MSELKRHHINEVVDMYNLTRGKMSYSFVYYADDVDKVIAELKDDVTYWKKVAKKNMDDNVAMARERAKAFEREHRSKHKQCLAMAQEWRSYATFCEMQSSWHNNRGFGKTAEKWTWKECHAWRCVKRWMEIAEKFKEAK